MKEKIEQIRGLLTQMEQGTEHITRVAGHRVLSGLELPDIIRDVVDLLMPDLKPYEAGLYLHFLRHSIVEKGTQYFRVSRRGLQSGIMKSSRPDGEGMSYATVREAMESLEKTGAIRQEGDANREGTLYRIIIPEEIETCRQRRADMMPSCIVVVSEREVDCYNVRENRIKIYERDNYHCAYCGKQLTRFTATLDHINLVSQGGDNSAQNLKTACLQCNSRKTARPLGDFLIEVDSA